MPAPLFSPHGQYRIFWCGDILCTELVGTFNEESIERYIQDMKREVAERTTHWGRLADMRRWDGGTPGAQALFKGFAEWIKTTHCKVSVQLLPDSFRLAIAANSARTLNTRHLYQVTDAGHAVQVLSDYQLDTQDLLGLLASGNANTLN